MCSILDYASLFWDPNDNVLINMLEAVQNCSMHFVTNSYGYGYQRYKFKELCVMGHP